MTKKVNLNALVGNTRERRSKKVFGDMEVSFDGQSIVTAICKHICQKQIDYVMGCAAWFTNKKIINAMSMHLKGCCMIVTKDKILRAKTTKMKYKKLPIYKDTAIRVIGCGRGYSKSLMHHKFMVGMCKDGNPLWVVTGSFNFTESATKHLENCLIISNPEVAKIYLDEFVRLYKVSKPLKIS